jgi:hypothetical protein
MPPPHSATYERLRQTIAERMRMRPIDQPLMLWPKASAQRLELLGCCSGRLVLSAGGRSPVSAGIALGLRRRRI